MSGSVSLTLLPHAKMLKCFSDGCYLILGARMKTSCPATVGSVASRDPKNLLAVGNPAGLWRKTVCFPHMLLDLSVGRHYLSKHSCLRQVSLTSRDISEISTL